MKKFSDSQFVLLALALALGGSTGCTVFDSTKAPTFDLSVENRSCTNDTDCASVTIVEERGNLLAGSDPDGDGPMPACLQVRVGCNTQSEVCEAIVTVRDNDGDGTFDPSCRGFGDFEPFTEDCDDTNPEIGARDADGDGQVSTLCVIEPGMDCDDTRASVFDGQSVEFCDGVISDCAARTGDPSAPAEDMDGDGFSPPGASCVAAGDEAPANVFAATDCDDANPRVFPGAPEVCDGLINDCVDGMGPRAGEDDDGDGFALPTADCEESAAFPKTDCDDSDGATYPDAPEVCDGLVNDCNVACPGGVCAAVRRTRLAEDADGDGFASFDAPCEAGALPFGDCIDGGDNDPTSQLCPAIEQMPAPEPAFSNVSDIRLTTDGNPITGGALLALRSLPPRELRAYSVDSEMNTLGALTVPSHTQPIAIESWASDPNQGVLLVHEFTLNPPTTDSSTVSRLTRAGGSISMITMATGRAMRDIAGTTAGTTEVIAGITGDSVALGPVLPARLNDQAIFTGLGTPGAVSLITEDTSARVVVGDRSGQLFEMVYDAGQLSILLSGGLPRPAVGATGSGLGEVLDSTEGDVDGSGVMDVVFGTTEGLAIVRDITRAAGIDPTIETFASRFAPITSVTTRDINLDGVPDIVAASEDRDSVLWIERVGDEWVEHPVVTDLNGASSAIGADVDGDGDVDIIGSAQEAGLITWWTREQVSNVGFGDGINVHRAFDSVAHVEVAPVDSGSRPDIIALGDRLSWWPVSELGVVGGETSIATGITEPRGLAAADLDGDGDRDVVIADGDTVRLYIASDNARKWDLLPVGTAAGAIASMAVHDVDNDGDNDVITLAGTAVELFLNDGGDTPTFTEETQPALTMAGSKLAVGDIDGDGIVEIAVTLSSVASGGVILYQRTDVSTAFTASEVTMIPATSAVTMADLNGDGLSDLVVGGAGFGTFFGVYSFASGSAVRVAAVQNADAPGVIGLRAVDVDSDGDLDLAYSRLVSGQKARWLENVRGDASVWQLHDIVTGGPTSTLGFDMGDIDGDGDVDAVLGILTEDQVQFYANDGVAWWRPRGN